MAITSPSEYLKAAQQEFKNMPVAAADGILDMCINSDEGCHILPVPSTVPARYHAHMQKIWNVMVFNILKARTSRNVSLAKWHQMLQNAL